MFDFDSYDLKPVTKSEVKRLQTQSEFLSFLSYLRGRIAELISIERKLFGDSS
jgi:hypothetical protein